MVKSVHNCTAHRKTINKYREKGKKKPMLLKGDLFSVLCTVMREPLDLAGGRNEQKRW